MNINYKVEDEFFKVTFCPDNQGLNLKKKKGNLVKQFYLKNLNQFYSKTFLQIKRLVFG